jgi:hypothetical protein
MAVIDDRDAVRQGYANMASYLYAKRTQARREAQREAATAQAKHMAARRNQQSSVTTIYSTPGYDSKDHEAQSVLRERMLNQMP